MLSIYNIVTIHCMAMHGHMVPPVLFINKTGFLNATHVVILVYIFFILDQNKKKTNDRGDGGTTE